MPKAQIVEEDANGEAVNPRAVPGDNAPPLEETLRDINEALPELLSKQCGYLVERSKELAESSKDVTSITTEEQEATATDIIAQLKAHIKLTDGRRLDINALPRKAQDIINAFFKLKAIDPLEEECNRINPIITKFKREKAERERREAEEKARIAREEAERQRREAEEAERKKREAEEAKRRAEQAAREAEERKKRAEEEARQAEERRKKAEADRIEAERRAKAARDQAEREAAERAAQAAKRAAEDEERAKQRAREDAERERIAAAAAKTDASIAKAELSDANRDHKTASSLAKAAESDADKADRAADANTSTFSGARGDYGGQSSLRTVWVGDLVDKDKLLKDAAKIWPFIAEADLQKAVNAFVKINKGEQKLKGVNIYEDTKTVVRG